MFRGNLRMVLLVLCCCLPVLLQGEIRRNYYFAHISGDEGLSQNDVKSVLQDSWGFMWFGTRNKLNRYDGKSIKIFDCYDAVADKRNNNINALFEDNDKKLWVGTDEGVFIFDPLTELFTFFNDTVADGNIIHNWVADIQQDTFGNIWIVAPGQGLFRYQSDEKMLYSYRFASNQPPNEGKPQSICIEKNGKVWVGTNGDGVFLYDRNSDSFSQIPVNGDTGSLSGEHIYTMCDYGDELVLGIHEGKLKKFHKLKNTLSDVNAPAVHYKIIRHVISVDEELWVGTEAGLYIVNERSGTTTHLHEDPLSGFALSDNMVEKIYQDKEEGIWVATYFGGVNYLPGRMPAFEHYVPLSIPGAISSQRIRELKEDNQGNIWIGTENGGANVLNPQTNIVCKIERGSGADPLYQKCLGLAIIDNKEVWIGFFKSGLDVVRLSDYKVTHYPAEKLGLNEASVTAILEDRFGNVWLGNAWGVYIAGKGEMKFRPVEELGSTYVYDLFEDSDGFIWVASMGMGVYRYDTKDKSVRYFQHNNNDPHSLSSNAVSSIMEDSRGYMWFSTDRGGICRYDKNTDRFTTYSVDEGLPDDVAYEILEDKNRNLWFGTNKGLVKFNPETNHIRVYTRNDGLLSNQFNYKSALAAGNKKFYFGGLDGLIAFDPYEIKENDFIPPVYITRLTSFNRELELNSHGSPLKESIIHTKQLILKHNHTNIGFDFAALSYATPSANRYAYKMEGLDDDWTYTTNNQSASYAKIPPGKYVFRVKASNNDGIWNEQGAQIKIIVQAPWWQSVWAYFVYVLFVVGVVILIINRYRKRNQEKIRLFEIEKEKELYSSKLDFFTNVAHEIRTPLSLINGPLESIQQMEIPEPELEKNLGIMFKNTNRLMRLVNQLLDFRKVDTNKLNMVFSIVNINDLLSDLVTQFETVATIKKKNIQLHLPDDTLMAPVDKNEFTKIISNLLSNAVKYSDKNIDVYLKVTDTYFIVAVSSDGELIPGNMSEKIFEPFYQLKKDENKPSGSGIGLSLVRSLVELHNGEIFLNTDTGLNNFILKLPLHQENVVDITENPAVQEEFIIDETILKQDKTNFEVVLVVEDNPEMLSFIADKLRDVFTVEKARNGVEALQVLEEKMVDIIVSDVMMPEMDGFELCRRLKQDIDYSHIPIVLLTAKNDLTSKIQGLEIGAEAYIEKPFSFNFLISQLTTLLNNRRREREAFMQKPFIPVQQMGMSKGDEKFMNRIIELIDENIQDQEFTIDHLASAVFMSRSSLNRKIKALSGLTPTDFIRLIRLKKAAKLIQNGEYRIAEVGYMVGINTPSYFIRLFQKQFGMTPKEFSKQYTPNP